MDKFNSENLNSSKEAVYGKIYAEASNEMNILQQTISLQNNKGFTTKQDCEKWASENLLDNMAYSPSLHKFFNISHKGELMTPQAFADYYGTVLFYMVANAAGTGNKFIRWIPEGFDFYNKARVPAEISDGIHRPLYYRDYTRPTGYYNRENGCFNIAKPFPFFARETGRDTSHIYTLIEHIAGECAMWLLAWLRMKMVNPCSKTQVVPIIVSRAQGSGKTSFGEVICKGLFGKDNVLVTDQYDSQARFNSDYADALIVCQEEKEETDRRNPVASIKSRATATTIRKEQKGIDPIYQTSYTDFLMTTNKDVPIKFEGQDDQRRFMIMQADENFTRKTSSLADEVFSKLYGYDANGVQVGIPFVEDKELIEQFKHELYTREDIKAVQLRQFPHTAAYKRCFSLPRTSEAVEVDNIIKALAPFIKATLEQKKVVNELENAGKLSSVIQFQDAFQYVSSYMYEGKVYPRFVALCRPLVFCDLNNNKPYQHSVVERALLDARLWLKENYGLDVIPDMDALLGGFTKVQGRYKVAPAAKICFAEDAFKPEKTILIDVSPKREEKIKESVERAGARFRVNNYFKRDPEGCYETVNELIPGTDSLKDKTKKCQYMDTFLFESDDCTKQQYLIEEKRAKDWMRDFPSMTIESSVLYRERLALQKSEAERLFRAGTACRVVYSGAKSYHILVRLADAPETVEQYNWLHAYLCTNLSDELIFDTSTSDPARLTRSPVTLDRETESYGLKVYGKQHLVAEDWSHIYSLQWRDLYEQWLNRPLKPYENKHGKRLIPSKPEYKEAMEAIIDGSFWTDKAFDGNRQVLFFPAYRLLRSLGYSHDELWTEDYIFKGLEGYAKREEISYWRSRANSGIIADIDKDFDEAADETEE